MKRSAPWCYKKHQGASLTAIFKMFQSTPISERRKQYNTESRENQWRKQKCMNG
nr:MAG TPA: hypothetical protein [Caudoviricetes sp.]